MDSPHSVVDLGYHPTSRSLIQGFQYTGLTAIPLSPSVLPEASIPPPPLLHGKESIRLLQYLSPEVPQLPLRFELRVFDVKQCPTYAALSYTWLNPFLHNHPKCSAMKNWDLRSEVIYCNGQPVSILPNLHEALQQMVCCHGETWLFVDALCINQHDAIEKASQVRLLTKVFTNAAHCICSLGSSDETLGTCTMAMETFARALEQARSQGKPPEAWTNLPIQHKTVLQYFSHSDRGVKELKKAIRAIAMLGKRRWFTRAWVVQEYALSRDAFLFCGGHTIDSQILRIVSLWLRHADYWDFKSLGMTSDEAKDTMQSIASIFELTESQNLFHQPDYVLRLRSRFGITKERRIQAAGLLDLLYRCRKCVAWDERDRIYALSGMLSIFSLDATPLELKPDYSLTPNEVFIQTASQMAQYLPVLDFLALAGWGSAPFDLGRLPSWVPHWAFLPEKKTFVSRKSYKAGLPLSSIDVGSRKLDGSILTLQGIFVETIRVHGSSFVELIDVANKYLDGSQGREAQENLRKFCSAMLWACQEETTETTEKNRTSTGLPYNQHDVSVSMLWLARERYRENPYEDEMHGIASFVNRICASTWPIQDIIHSMKLSREETKRNDAKKALRMARFEGRKRANLVSCFTQPHGKAFCYTSKGNFGTGPPCIQAGDRIYILRDARLPCLLRPAPGRGGYFHFVGEIYVANYVLGQALQGSSTHWTDVCLQ